MAIRWRKNGTLICAAKSKAAKGDTYIDDRLHYQLSVIQKVLVPSKDEESNGLWFWLHSECSRTDHPQIDKCDDGVFVRAELD